MAEKYGADKVSRMMGYTKEDGVRRMVAQVAKGMQEANMGWHIKPQDGFGHTAMGWFASGRPVVTHMSDVVAYGHDAPKLFEPGVTCINLQTDNFENNCKKIREWLEPENNIKYSENAYTRFNEVVNYNEEEQQIKEDMEGEFAWEIPSGLF